MLSFICVTFLTIFLAVYLYFKWNYTYWQRKGVPFIPPTFPFGNVADLVTNKVTFGVYLQNLYAHFKRLGLPYGGVFFFGRKTLILCDPELIKDILVKDFQHFVNHGLYINEEVDPLTGHLFLLEDTKWKKLREKLTPTFTSGKMKMMFHTMTDCADNLSAVIQESAGNGDGVDIKDVLARFSTDIIASCAFGIESNCLKNPQSEFHKYGQLHFQTDYKESLKNLIQVVVPSNVLGWFNFKMTKQPVEDFMLDLVKRTVEYREKNNIFRKDFMHLLIQLKNMGKVTDDERIKEDNIGENGLTINELAAQAFVFFIAGFETSSTTMTFTLYELALNLDVQNMAREEIRDILKKYDNKLTYEAVMEMKYLDKVVQEALRKYPPAPILARVCNKDYPVANSDFVIEKGIQISIPLLGLQRDHEFFPNPEQFDPERFNEENKLTRPQFSYLSFGEGPRICIGSRFGLLQTKIGLITLLKDYQVSINRKTTVPIKFDTTSIILTAEGRIWLDVTKV